MVDNQEASVSVMPSVERIQQELARAKSVDDFFGKDGIFARLFADTIEQMLEAELTAHLGYPRHAPEGRNSGNSRNGKRTRQLRTSTGDTTIQVPRDRNSTFQSPLLDAYQTSTNELEDKIIGLYAKGMSARDIQDTLQQAYGVEVSAATISTVTDKVWSNGGGSQQSLRRFVVARNLTPLRGEQDRGDFESWPQPNRFPIMWCSAPQC